MSDEQKPVEQPRVDLVAWEPASATEAWQLAKYYQASALLPRALKNIADVFVTIAAGRDFGWSPMQSMRGIHVVDGKPSLSADAMVGLAKSSALCEYFNLVDSTAQIATFETKRKGDLGPTRMSFTIEEAHAAGLAGKAGPWKNYPARMLRNRCKSALCKEVYEEIFFGVYEEDEAREIDEQRKPSLRTQAGPARIVEPAAAAASVTVDAEVVTEKKQEQQEPTPGAAGVDEQREPAAADEPEQATIAEKFAVRISEAATVDALAALGAEIKRATDSGIINATERAVLKIIYEAQRKAVLVPEAQP